MAVGRLGISSDAFYNLDAVELYWAYKIYWEGKEQDQQRNYEVSRFLGILIKNPKLLSRLAEVLPFTWEKGKKAVKQTVGEMKQAVLAIARAQGVRKTPLKKRTTRIKKKKR